MMGQWGDTFLLCLFPARGRSVPEEMLSLGPVSPRSRNVSWAPWVFLGRHKSPWVSLGCPGSPCMIKITIGGPQTNGVWQGALLGPRCELILLSALAAYQVVLAGPAS